MTGSARKWYFLSGEEDVKTEDLHLAVFANTRTDKMVYESALVRCTCCWTEGVNKIVKGSVKKNVLSSVEDDA